MKFCYYPGCTLKNKAKKFDIYARKIAEFFDINLEEIPSWQCCGGLYTSSNDIATKLSSIRNLNYAKEQSAILITLCASCHNVLKRVNYDMKENAIVQTRANNYLGFEFPYQGETTVLHFLELLRDYVGFDLIKSKVTKPLSKKVACYYGCQLLRPSLVMQFDNPENPTIMQNLISAIGGTNTKFDFQNECCGSYDSIKNPENVKRLCEKISNNARENGAEIIVTACPLCMYNLKKYSTLPVVYFTELLAESLNITLEEKV